MADAEASGSGGRPADENYLQDDSYGKIQFGEFSKYLANKRTKTQFQNRQFQQDFAGDTPQILAGLAFYINGQTEIPIADLQTLIKLHGGTIVPVLDRKGQVAGPQGFIIASNLTPTKRAEFKSYKVVREDWILRSCASGRLLDWRDFTLRLTQQVDFGNGQWPGGTPVAQPTLFDMRPREPAMAPTASTSKLQPEAPPGPTSPRVSPRRRISRENQQFEREVPGYIPDKPTHRAADLLQDEAWRNKNTAIAPDFIEGYYKNSRLHHLSTWKAELPNMIGNLTAELLAEGKSAPPQTAVASAGKNMGGRHLSGTESDGRCIMHVDFDCMFASAGLVAQPELKGVPVAVCHAKGDGSFDGSTSEISSCSYEARAFGVKNGMSLGQARKLCPDIQTMAYDFELYSSMSNKFYKILLSFADQLQPVSVDECYIEVSQRLSEVRPRKTPKQLAEDIRDAVRKATKCEVSIGISHNLVLARLATKTAKPAKAFHLLPDQVSEYLAPLKVADLPGVGYAAREKFKSLGIVSIGDLLSANRSKVLELMGPNHGAKLLNYAKGADPTPLQPPGPRKSVSVELNYAIRLSTDAEAETLMNNLSAELVRRLNALATRGAHLTLKVMKRAPDAPIETPKFLGHGVCDLENGTHNFHVATADLALIAPAALRMLQRLDVPCQELRGVGLQMTKLESMAFHSGQQRLAFAPSKPSTARGSALSEKVVTPKRSRSPSQSPPRAFKVPTAMTNAPKKASRQVTLLPAKSKPALQTKKSSAPVQAKISTDGALSLALKQQRQVYHADKVTDGQLQALGLDPGVFRMIPYTMRQDALSNARAELLAQDTERAKVKAFEVARGFRGLDSTTSSEAHLVDRIDLAQLNAPTPDDPTFGKLEDLDDVRHKLQAWVVHVGDAGPAERDVKKLETFLARCLEPEGRSPDLERVTLALGWLNWVVSQRGAASQAAWTQPMARLREQVEAKVFKIKGRKVSLLI